MLKESEFKTKEEYIVGCFPKQNNYYYERKLLDNIDTAILHYKLTDNIFNKHINYCKEKGIIPKVKNQWIEILINWDMLEEINGYCVALKAAHCNIRVTNKLEYWEICLKSAFNRCQIHRFVMNPESKDIHIDHIKNNRFDNRREMLKEVTKSENMQNRRGAASNSKSGIRGVCKIKNKGHFYWIVQVYKDKKRVFKKNFPYTPEGLKEAKKTVIEARNKFFTNNLVDRKLGDVEI